MARALAFTVQVEVTRDAMAADPFAGGSFAPASGRVARSTGGSGFVLDPSGLIATNAHVVAGAIDVEVRLHDGHRYPAVVVATDAALDLAVLRIDAGRPLSAAALGDSRTARQGDLVWALGAPLGYGFSVTAGVISGRDRTYGEQYAVALLQHDAALNPGSSGGPLVDLQGRVIGINTATPPQTLFDIGVGLAIPAEIAGPALRRLALEGHIARGRLGLSVAAADMDVATALGATQPGLLVETIADSGAARRGGLAVGDLLLSLDRTRLGAPVDLARALLFSSPGQVVVIAYYRDGVPATTRVRLEADPGVMANASPQPAASSALDPRITLTASNWDGGVVVGSVGAGGGGALYGLRPGDRLRAVNGRTPTSPTEALALLAVGRAEAALLRIERPGEVPRHLILPLTWAAAARRPPGRLSDAPAGPF